MSGKAACLHASNPKFTQKSGTAGFVESLKSVVQMHCQASFEKFFFSIEKLRTKPQSFSSKGCPRTFWIRLVPYDHHWGQFQNGWLMAPLMKVRMMAQPSQSVTLNHPPNGSRNARMLKRLNRNPSNQSKKRNTLFLKKAK